MKENEEIFANEINTPDDFRKKLTGIGAENDKALWRFRDNATYMESYIRHIRMEMEKKQEEYKQFNRNSINRKLADRIKQMSEMERTFATLGKNPTNVDDEEYRNAIEGLKTFKKTFLDKNERQEAGYSTFAAYNESFPDGMDKEVFISTVDEIGNTVGFGLSEGAAALESEPRQEDIAETAGEAGLKQFRTSPNVGLLLRYTDPDENFSGALDSFKEYRENLQKQFDRSRDDREKDALYALMKNCDKLEDLRQDYKKHFFENHRGGDVRPRQDLLIQMDKTLRNIQALHVAEAQKAPRNSFLRNDKSSFAAPEFAQKYAISNKDAAYLFDNTYHYFVLDDPKNKEQYYYRTRPLSFEVPSYADPKIAALYLARNKELSENGEKSEIYDEFSIMRSNLRYITENTVPPTMLSEDETVNVGFKMAASKLYKSVKELDESISRSAGSLDTDRADASLNETAKKIIAFQNTIESIRNDYRDNPEVLEKVDGICGSFFSRWQTMDITNGLQTYKDNHKDVAFEAPKGLAFGKRSFEMYDGDLHAIAREQVQTKAIDMNAVNQETQAIRDQGDNLEIEVGKKFLTDAADNKGAYKTLKGVFNEISAIKELLDSKYKSGDLSGQETSTRDYLINTDLYSKLNNLCREGEKYKEAKNNGNPAIDDNKALQINTMLQDLKQAFRGVNVNNMVGRLLSDKFKRRMNGLADYIDEMQKAGAVTENDMDHARRYVCTQTGSNMPGEGAARTQAAANALSAYIWIKSAQKVKDGEKKPVFKESKIEDYARTIEKNPIFKTAIKKHDLNPYDVKNLALIHDHMNRPFSQNFDNDLHAHEKVNKALKSLKELGTILDHCNGAGNDYKAFFKSLKKLENVDLDYLSMDKKCDLLNDIYHCTEKYMKGRKSTRFFKESREHFEQCLDVLAILKEHGGYGKDIADALVDRTNEVRRKHWFQKEVTLEGRSNANTRKRLMKLRNVQKTEKADAQIELRDKAIDKEGLIRANEDLMKKANNDKLTLSFDTAPIDVEKKKEEFKSYLENGTPSMKQAKENISQMLALSIVPAYKDIDGKPVVEAGTFNKACEIMKEHEITGQLADKYRFRTERKELLNEAEPLKKLRSEFDTMNKELIQKRKLEDAELLGKNAAGMTYEEYKNACEEKRKNELEEQKAQRKEEKQAKKQQRLSDEEMDREYIKYLDRITSANKIDSKRRIELLSEYYISGDGKRPVPEEDLEQVQKAVQNKENKQQNVMGK